jgi:hypothetical protein
MVFGTDSRRWKRAANTVPAPPPSTDAPEAPTIIETIPLPPLNASPTAYAAFYSTDPEVSVTSGGVDDENVWRAYQRTGAEHATRRRKLAIIGISVAVVVSLLSLGFYFIDDSIVVERALSDCHNSRVLYDAARKDYDAQHNSVEAMANITKEQVVDASTVSEFSNLLNRTITSPMECTAETGVQSVYVTTEQLDQSTLFLEKGMKELSRAARKVETSREEKIFRSSVDHAHTLLMSLQSEGNDSESLTNLEREINQDQKMLEDEKTEDFMVLQSAEERLEDAMDGVTRFLQSR